MRKSYESIEAAELVQHDDNVSYALIAQMIGTGKTVLDVGCGPGNLAVILARAGCEVTGLDADTAALRAADRYCVGTTAIDLNVTALADAVGAKRFDAVVFADVLQHVADPARLLTSARAVLAPGGFIVVSIPNVAHGAVRLALLRGRFEYQRLGILDEAHMRFFTAESIERLFEESGYVIGGTLRTKAPVFEESDLVPHVRREDFDPAVVDEVLAYPESDTLQFIMRGYPLDDDDLVLRLRADIMSLEQNVRTLQAQLAQAARAGGGADAADAGGDLHERYREAIQAADALRRQLANKDAMARAERARLADEITRANADAEQLRAAAGEAQAECARLAAAIARRDEEFARASAQLAQREAEGSRLAQLSTDVATREAELDAVREERDRLSAVFARMRSAYEENAARLAFAEIERERLAERLERSNALLELREASARDQDAAADRMLSALAQRRHRDDVADGVALDARAQATFARIAYVRDTQASHETVEPAAGAMVRPRTELRLIDEALPTNGAAGEPSRKPALQERIARALGKAFPPR